MQYEEDMQQDPPSPVQDVSVTQQDPLDTIPTTEVITPIASHSEMTNKRTFSYGMEIDQEGNS